MRNLGALSKLIYRIRGRRVMLSVDLAKLYDVAPRALIQAVKRNRDHFPRDFLFQLSRAESENLKSQSVISSWGGARARPYAFTEEGVAMRSSVLRSKRAVRANIAIMRTFVRIRELCSQDRDILRHLGELEIRVDRHDTEIAALIDAIRDDAGSGTDGPRQIGFQPRDG
jgi:hypothetical protein